MSLIKNKTGLGGIWQAIIILAENVQDDNPQNFMYSSGVPLAFVQETAKFSQKSKITRQGKIYEQSLTFIMAQYREEIREWILDNSEKEFLIILVDAQEKNYLMGSIDYSCELTENFDTGTALANRNDIKFDFVVDSFEPISIINAVNDKFEICKKMKVQTLGTSPNYIWNAYLGYIGQINLTEDSNIAFPTNLQEGESYALYIKQDNTGGHSLTFAAGYYFPQGLQPDVATTANSISVVTFIYDGSILAGVANNPFISL